MPGEKPIKRTRGGSKPKPAANESGTMKILSALVARAQLASAMGKTHGGDRDLYTKLGYDKNPDFAEYYWRYRRQDVAKRVVDAPVDATWKGQPVLTENDKEDPENETGFEEKWGELVDNLGLYNKFARVDRLAGIGQYAVLLLGFDGVEGMEAEVTGAKELLYVQPYSQNNATIKEWDKDVTSPRYGLPLIYELTTKLAGSSETSTKSFKVHHSRVLHIAEGLLESNVYGTPRLEAILNRLFDLDKIAGGSAEMFWLGAFPGLAFKADPEADVGGQNMADLGEEIDEYMHGLRRYLRMQGMEIQQLDPKVVDPEKYAELQLKLISGETGIPVRILTGSERGELASSQDQTNWLERVAERRTDFAEPTVVRPFIDKLVAAGVLKEPADGYMIEWPDLFALGDKERADIGKTRTESLVAYANSPGADMLVPPEVYLEQVLGFTREEIKTIEELVLKHIEDEAELEPEEEEVQPVPGEVTDE